MNQHEEERAWQVFRRELDVTRDPRAALHAALVDVESRLIPAERQRCATVERGLPLLARHRTLVEAICAETGANLAIVCSFNRAGPAEVQARSVLVGVMDAAGLSARQIGDGFGISNSVVNNCRAMSRAPETAPLVAKYLLLVKTSQPPK